MAGTGGGRRWARRRAPWTVPLCAAATPNAEEQRRGRGRRSRTVSAAAPQAEDVGLSRRRLRTILCSGHAHCSARSVGQFGLPSSLQSHLELSAGCRVYVLHRPWNHKYLFVETRRDIFSVFSSKIFVFCIAPQYLKWLNPLKYSALLHILRLKQADVKVTAADSVIMRDANLKLQESYPHAVMMYWV